MGEGERIREILESRSHDVSEEAHRHKQFQGTEITSLDEEVFVTIPLRQGRYHADEECPRFRSTENEAEKRTLRKIHSFKEPCQFCVESVEV